MLGRKQDIILLPEFLSMTGILTTKAPDKIRGGGNPHTIVWVF